MKTLTQKNSCKDISIFFLIFIAIFIFLPQKARAYEYASPAWMDNDHIICVKYVPTTKKRLIPFLGDISDARYILTKQEIQIVSMDINGNNEKVIKSIVIDYPGMSPKWQEEIFQGMNRIDQIAYCPQRKLIAFSTHGFTERVYMINADGTGAKRIAEIGGGMYFSPDGKYMEYTSKYKVWLYDLDTGEQKVLIEDAVSGPWSPDGKWVYRSLQGDHTNNFKKSVELVNMGTGKKIIIEDGDNLKWSPTGYKFIYSITKKTDKVYVTTLYINKLVNNEVVIIDFIPNAISALWNIDGSCILFKDNIDGKIYLLNIDSKQKRLIFEPGSYKCFSFTKENIESKKPCVAKIYPYCCISQDKIVVQSLECVFKNSHENISQYSVLVIDINNSSITFRHILEDGMAKILLSPDGRKLLFYDRSKLKVLTNEGTKVIQLAEDTT